MFVRKSYWWFVFVGAFFVIDYLTYVFQQQAVVPISVVSIYNEYSVNHQALTPMLFGPFITITVSYLITTVLVK